MYYKQLVLAIILISLSICVTAQFDSLGLNTPWNEGTLNLSDHSTLSGFIQYNDKQSVVKFRRQIDDDSEEKTLDESDIQEMHYFDSENSVNRRFATFDYYQDDSGTKGYVLFEIIEEFRNFAVVSRYSSVSALVKRSSRLNTISSIAFGYSPHYTAHQINYKRKAGYKQTGDLFIVDQEGQVSLLLRVYEIEKNNGKQKKVSAIGKFQPRFNESLFRKHANDYWEALEDYIMERKLNLEDRMDVIDVLNFYGRLESKEDK